MAKEAKATKGTSLKTAPKKATKAASKPLPPLPKPVKAQAAAPKPAAEKSPIEKPDPVWVEQLDERGNVEKVDFNLYCNIITCSVPGCENVRYVKNADRHQVTMCKPCARRERRKRIRARRKERGKTSGFVEKKKAAKAAKK